MKSLEYFVPTRDTRYSLIGIGSTLPASRERLPEGTEYFQLVTYVGPPSEETSFYELKKPAAYPVIPLISSRTYSNFLRFVGVPPSPNNKKWVDYPTEPLIHSTLGFLAHVQIPNDPTNKQGRATISFQEQTPKDVPNYPRALFIEKLQKKGFPPDSFSHLFDSGNRLRAIVDIFRLGRDPKPPPSGVLLERVRTSRHTLPI